MLADLEKPPTLFPYEVGPTPTGLEQFIDRNNLRDRIQAKALDFAIVGYRRMEKSKDPSHQATHIDRLLSLLTGFLHKNPLYLQRIDWPVLLIGLTWHDIWKAENFNSHSVSDVQILIDNYREGKEAADLTAWEMYLEGFPEETINKVSHVIYKHSDFQILPTLNLEAQILADLDWYDMWSLDRIPEYLRHLAESPNVDPNSLKSQIMLKLYRWLSNQHLFNTRYFQELALQQIPVFEREVDKALKEYKAKQKKI